MPNPPHSIGLPRMLTEAGEKRVFLPEFIHWLAQEGLTVCLEIGYGKPLNLSFSDYQASNANIIETSRQECFRQDLVLVLRSPSLDEYSLLGKNSTFITMLHFPTRPERVALLNKLGLRAISLDSIADHRHIRLVENMRSVAWNGIEAGYGVLETIFPKLNKPDGTPIKALILGTGMVGKHAVEAITKLGNEARNKQHMAEGGRGAIAVSLGRNLTGNRDTLEKLFADTDMLVDATQRRDSSKPVITNHMLAALPEHAVIVDLSVDPYALNTNLPVVKGVEGIPQGNLDKYVYAPSDSDYLASVPDSIPHEHRRHVVSCYSWPGVHPRECMQHYASQLQPLIRVLLAKGYDQLDPNGDYFEQALYTGTLKSFLASSAT